MDEKRAVDLCSECLAAGEYVQESPIVEAHYRHHGQFWYKRTMLEQLEAEEREKEKHSSKGFLVELGREMRRRSA